MKRLFWAILVLVALIISEDYVRDNQNWLNPLSKDNVQFNIDQLGLYAQLLTAIFSIYFATIGIILSASHTTLRRDIIQMLTNEQVGSLYSCVLVYAAMFCLAATTLPLFGFEPGLFVCVFGTILTLLSASTLFPLGQRLFYFFDLSLLVRAAILPNIGQHIKKAANPKNSMSSANHHSKAAHRALEQLSYIDTRIKTNQNSMNDNIPSLTDDYTNLLLYYIQKKRTIDQESYWFPRRRKHKKWFYANYRTTSLALKTSSQLIGETSDQGWLENEIVERLAGHIKLAFEVGDFELALKLLGRFQDRMSAYVENFMFEFGMRELKKLKEIIEQALTNSGALVNDEAAMTRTGIADSWFAFGSDLCLETIRRMINFEEELERFFEADEWSKKSLQKFPVFLQIEFAFIVERIEFEKEMEGCRLSKQKYVQQLAVQKLLQYHANILPQVCGFYEKMVPEFVETLTKLKVPEAATQVILASLHSHWKLRGRFEDLTPVLDRYRRFEHYTEAQYKLPTTDLAELSNKIKTARDNALEMLGNAETVKHIFKSKYNEELPDHFGQIYFELAEACINALEENNEGKLNRVFPMFMKLAFLAADFMFADSSLDVNEEFRLHLVSTVIKDLASVLGFAILYGAYFNDEKLSDASLAKFDELIGRTADKQQYLKRMMMVSNPSGLSMIASPRELIRTEWKISFERRARRDGFEIPSRMERGKPHMDKTVKVFLKSNSDASHLFFAKHVLPSLETTEGMDIDHHIKDLALWLNEEQ